MSDSRQLDLLPGLARIPAARSSDPVTSYEAVEEIDAQGVRERQGGAVLGLVAGEPGSTSRELGGRVVGLDRYVVARRLPELESLGAVERGKPRICRIGGRRAVTWSLTDLGRRWLERGLL